MRRTRTALRKCFICEQARHHRQCSPRFSSTWDPKTAPMTTYTSQPFTPTPAGLRVNYRCRLTFLCVGLRFLSFRYGTLWQFRSRFSAQPELLQSWSLFMPISSHFRHFAAYHGNLILVFTSAHPDHKSIWLFGYRHLRFLENQ